MNKETIHWIIAAIFWTLALVVLYFNISRQFKNNSNPNKRISGVPFLFTIFVSIGAAASPLNMAWIAIPALIFEIPALADFKGEDHSSH